MRMYRVLVEYDDGDSWDKEFEEAHDALAFYRRCADSRIVHGERATVKAQRREGEWKTVLKSEIFGLL